MLTMGRMCEVNAPFATRVTASLVDLATVATTMIYTHVLKLGGGAVRSPIDAMSLT